MPQPQTEPNGGQDSAYDSGRENSSSESLTKISKGEYSHEGAISHGGEIFHNKVTFHNGEISHDGVIPYNGNVSHDLLLSTDVSESGSAWQDYYGIITGIEYKVFFGGLSVPHLIVRGYNGDISWLPVIDHVVLKLSRGRYCLGCLASIGEELSEDRETANKSKTVNQKGKLKTEKAKKEIVKTEKVKTEKAKKEIVKTDTETNLAYEPCLGLGDSRSLTTKQKFSKFCRDCQKTSERQAFEHFQNRYHFECENFPQRNHLCESCERCWTCEFLEQCYQREGLGFIFLNHTAEIGSQKRGIDETSEITPWDFLAFLVHGTRDDCIWQAMKLGSDFLVYCEFRDIINTNALFWEILQDFYQKGNIKIETGRGQNQNHSFQEILTTWLDGIEIEPLKIAIHSSSLPDMDERWSISAEIERNLIECLANEVKFGEIDKNKNIDSSVKKDKNPREGHERRIQGNERRTQGNERRTQENERRTQENERKTDYGLKMETLQLETGIHDFRNHSKRRADVDVPYILNLHNLKVLQHCNGKYSIQNDSLEENNRVDSFAFNQEDFNQDDYILPDFFHPDFFHPDFFHPDFFHPDFFHPDFIHFDFHVEHSLGSWIVGKIPQMPIRAQVFDSMVEQHRVKFDLNELVGHKIWLDTI